MINRLSELTLSLQVRAKFVHALKGQNIVAQGKAKRRQPQAPPWVSENTSVPAEKTGVVSAAVDRGRNRPGPETRSENRVTLTALKAHSAGLGSGAVSLRGYLPLRVSTKDYLSKSIYNHQFINHP